MSAMSLEVPPTSMLMRSSSPASAPTAAPPSAPAAGPERNRRPRTKRAVSRPARPPGPRTRKEQPYRPQARRLGAGQAATGLHHLQRNGHIRLGEMARHVGEIAIDNRLDVGVKGRNDGALVLSKCRIHLAG